MVHRQARQALRRDTSDDLLRRVTATTFSELKLPPAPLFVDDPLAKPVPPAVERPTVENPHPATAIPQPAPASTAGWSNGDRFTTGENRDWADFQERMAEARASGADVGIFVPPVVSRLPLPEPAAWRGPIDDDPEVRAQIVAMTKALESAGLGVRRLRNRPSQSRF